MVVITNREKRWGYLTPDDFAEAEKNGISYHTAHTRVYKYGWEINRAITQPVQKNSREPSKWNEWKGKAVVCKSTFVRRIKEGWNEEKAALTPGLSYIERAKKKRRYTDEQIATATQNGIPMNRVRYRVNAMNWDIERAITTPVMTKSQAAQSAMAKRWARN